MRLPQSVRAAGAALVGSIPMRIRSGPNRGLRWALASAGRGAVAGTFEEERVNAIMRFLHPGDVVWDIGAHKGYVSMAAARRVGNTGEVYAFEPAPPNLAFLERHIHWNHLDNVRIMPVAVSSADGTARFGGGGSSITYRLDGGDYEVRVRSIASLLAEGLKPPTVIKIDVEGSESEVLRGADDTLPQNALLFVAIHSREQYRKCTEALRSRSFHVVDSAAIRRIHRENPNGWEADPDIIAIGPRCANINDAALAAYSHNSDRSVS